MWGKLRFKTPRMASDLPAIPADRVEKAPDGSSSHPRGSKRKRERNARQDPSPHREAGTRQKLSAGPTSPMLGPESSHTEWLELGRLARSRRVRVAESRPLCSRSFTSQQQNRVAEPCSSTRFTSNCTPGWGKQGQQDGITAKKAHSPRAPTRGRAGAPTLGRGEKPGNPHSTPPPTLHRVCLRP